MNPHDGISVLILLRLVFLDQYDPKSDKYKEGHTEAHHNQNNENNDKDQILKQSEEKDRYITFMQEQ